MPLGDHKLALDEPGCAGSGEPAGPARMPVHVVLEDIRSGHNVGSIFRTADAFRLAEMVLCGFTPGPPDREVAKTALGATASVPWTRRENGLLAVRSLIEAGCHAVAVEQTLHARSIGSWSPPPDRPLALIFGNELRGVSQGVIEACHECLCIPQFGAKRSLNVSVCAGIVLWWAAGRPPGPVSLPGGLP